LSQGLLVGQYDLFFIGLHLEGNDNACPQVAGVVMDKGLLVAVDGFFFFPDQDLLGQPLPEGGGGPGIAVVGSAVAGVRLPVFQANNVIRAAPVVLLLFLRLNYIVRGSNHGAQVRAGFGVVADAMKRTY